MTRAQWTIEALARMMRAYAFSRAHSRLAQWAGRKYGDHGPLISGIVREHFPENVRETLRTLARQVGRDLDDSRVAWSYARRQHTTWMRAKERTIAEHGRGFYG